MKKKLFNLVIGVGIFTTGVFFGKHLEKRRNLINTNYAGTLQIHEGDVEPELYLALSISPEKLQTSTDVIFKVNRFETK